MLRLAFRKRKSAARNEITYDFSPVLIGIIFFVIPNGLLYTKRFPQLYIITRCCFLWTKHTPNTLDCLSCISPLSFNSLLINRINIIFISFLDSLIRMIIIRGDIAKADYFIILYNDWIETIFGICPLRFTSPVAKW